MWSLICTILIIFTLHRRCLSGISDYSPSNFDYNVKLLNQYQTVGFFSRCDGEGGEQGTTFNTRAKQVESWINETLAFQKMYNFITHDVCNDTDLLVRLITDLVLDDRNFFHSEHLNGTNQKEVLSSRDQNIILIVAYVSEEMSKMIQEIAGNLYPLIAKLCEPFQCDEHFTAVKMNGFIGQISDFVTRFGMRDITFINIEYNGQEPTEYQTYYNKTYEFLKSKSQFCLRRKTFMNGWQAWKSSKRNQELLREEIAPFLNQNGAQKSIVLFFGHTFEVGQMARSLSSREDFDQIFPGRLLLFQDIDTFDGDNKNIINLQYSMRTDLFFTKVGQPIPNYNMVTDVTSILKALNTALLIHESSSNAEILQNVYKDIYEKVLNRYNYILPAIRHVWLESLIPIVSNAYLDEAKFKPIFCRPDLICPPGHHKRYGNVNITKGADDEHSFKCDPCPLNTIKVDFADGPCVPCTGTLSIDNGKRTACIDPYNNVKMFFNQQQHILTLSLSCFGTFLTSFVIIVFYVNHETPIVLSSDKNWSFVHLASLLGIFIGIICLYALPYLEVEICVCRNLIYSIIYTFHVACLYVKSQKLVKAFNSKIRLTASTFRKTLLTQLFTILILFLINNGCLFISYVQWEPKLNFYLDCTMVQRIHYCNTGVHQNLQILLLTSYQLMCSVQAYRCRKLPDFMNDAMSLFYAILITSVSFGVSFPMSYFRRQPIDKEFVGVIIMLINCYVTLLLLYAKKCYIMLWKPNKNTRDYFQKRRMEYNGLNNVVVSNTQENALRE